MVLMKTMIHQILMKRRKRMSRTNNAGVIDLWKRGFEASSHNGALTSNGVELFSYNLKIGHRSGTGVCVVGDYTSPGGGFYSNTTSTHVGKARSAAGHVMHPVIFEKSFPR